MAAGAPGKGRDSVFGTVACLVLTLGDQPGQKVTTVTGDLVAAEPSGPGAINPGQQRHGPGQPAAHRQLRLDRIALPDHHSGFHTLGHRQNSAGLRKTREDFNRTGFKQGSLRRRQRPAFLSPRMATRQRSQNAID